MRNAIHAAPFFSYSPYAHWRLAYLCNDVSAVDYYWDYQTSSAGCGSAVGRVVRTKEDELEVDRSCGRSEILNIHWQCDCLLL